jgi:hypothetical protein
VKLVTKAINAIFKIPGFLKKRFKWICIIFALIVIYQAASYLLEIRRIKNARYDAKESIKILLGTKSTKELIDFVDQGRTEEILDRVICIINDKPDSGRAYIICEEWLPELTEAIGTAGSKTLLGMLTGLIGEGLIWNKNDSDETNFERMDNYYTWIPEYNPLKKKCQWFLEMREKYGSEDQQITAKILLMLMGFKKKDGMRALTGIQEDERSKKYHQLCLLLEAKRLLLAGKISPENAKTLIDDYISKNGGDPFLMQSMKYEFDFLSSLKRSPSSPWTSDAMSSFLDRKYKMAIENGLEKLRFEDDPYTPYVAIMALEFMPHDKHWLNLTQSHLSLLNDNNDPLWLNPCSRVSLCANLAFYFMDQNNYTECKKFVELGEKCGTSDNLISVRATLERKGIINPK